ncbi:phosphotransferase [Jiangella endophytica]|uniref:phosphotransferase n=1 Tax=Jiangella endophytica TaxID=1623398 RepID=UPI0018E53951|nr:phosphotransferase [Jiangella endophytica]
MLPDPVLQSLTGRPPADVADIDEVALGGGTGAATAGLTRLTVRLRDGREATVIRKECQPLTSGRHRHGATDPRHWAYWRREPLAYASGLLPSGPGLRAPRCHGVVDEVVYLEDAGATPADVRTAARQLGAWQSGVGLPDVPWLGGHQLAQRVAVSELDWSAVDADERAVRLWSRRDELLALLAALPRVVSHGDFHPLNLRADGSDTVALDWGTMSAAPVGADVAHLALGAQADVLDDYLAGADGAFSRDDVDAGCRATLVLVGASRVHWMLTTGASLPPGYVDFLWAHRP